MIFHSARCETCGKYLFKPEDCLAYQRTVGRGIQICDLKGRNPWVGVFVLCFKCVSFFGCIYQDVLKSLDKP